MRKLGATLLLAAVTTTAPAYLSAQEDAEAGAVAAVQALFDAMAARDGEAIRDLLTDGAVFTATAETADGVEVRESTGAEFAASIGQPGPALLERMWDPHVMIQGPLAVVWTPYDFHVDGEFSHCGIDAVSLAKTAAGWKISSIAYTRERDGCAPSPLGPPGG
ncbi:nuclear transport factor 2 family protein [Candidatus Palauibacter sp.]|uniref:nuclear transport factor 2 family protein n=1 Tax=Candidatus Palauibacter sp. TaxID=3101350 RepID=UPI003C705DED